MISKPLKIIIWNANGLAQRALELKQFITEQSADILIISETHFTNKSFLKIPNYNIYNTNHPSGRGHGGTAIIASAKLKCIELGQYNHEFLQSTAIQIEDISGALTIAALYCPPKHTITPDQYCTYLKTLGQRYIVGGDFNAKHIDWGSRMTNVKGRNLLKAIRICNSNHISTGEPTYWPSDPKKKPDLIDFCIIKNVDKRKISMQSCLDLSSDHSPIILEYSSEIVAEKVGCRLYNKKTDWETFREIVELSLTASVSLKEPDEIESAVVLLNDVVTEAALQSTPINTPKPVLLHTPAAIRNKIQEKRKLRKRWQCTRCPADKTKLNKATADLKQALRDLENEKTHKYLSSLTATSATDYSLWKATKALKVATLHKPPIKNANGSWARTNIEKASVLANYYQDVFSNQSLHTNTLPLQVLTPDTVQIKRVSVAEIQKCINNRIAPKKSPGYDCLTGALLRELPICAIAYIRNIYNAMLALNYFPKVWKVAEIIAIPKPGKDATEATSYRPISLLPVLSKVFEKIFLDRLEIVLERKQLIPDHQFGFRQRHSTVQQIHRVVNKISSDLDEKRVCVGVYLDVAKAFDKVWHKGLLHKLREQLPLNFFLLIESYLCNRTFYVKYNDAHSTLHKAEAGVPQGSVLGPILYLLYTADIPLPTQPNTMLATFADDTVVLSSDTCIKDATRQLQLILNSTLNWFNTWNLKINEDKTIQVIYTNKTKYSPEPLFINGKQLQIEKSAKYLGMHIDNKLTWKQHITSKRNQLKLKLSQLYWLLGKDSKLSMNNKLLVYKAIIKPIWTYGVELWGTASTSNIQPIQRLQSKILRIIANAIWYVPNCDIHRDLRMLTVNEEITHISEKHQHKISAHSNVEVNTLPFQEATRRRRLRRYRPSDLPSRFKK